MKISIKETCNFIKSKNNFTLLTHKSPDGDTLGSSFALKYALEKLGKNVNVFCSDEMPVKFKFLGSLSPINIPSSNFFIVSIDLADTNLLGDHLKFLSQNIDLCIDHHFSNTLYAKKSLIVENAAATAEIIYDVINELGVKIDQQIASCIYTGISTDTGCFKYPNTTAKTHFVAAKMFECGCDFKFINKLMFETKTITQIEIQKFVLNNLETFFDGTCAIIQIPYELKTSLNASDDELDLFASIPREIQGVLVGITLKEKEPKKIKVSVRTDGEINASKICSSLGGGGHHAAAGCFINASLDEAKEKLLEVVKKELNQKENHSDK